MFSMFSVKVFKTALRIRIKFTAAIPIVEFSELQNTIYHRQNVGLTQILNMATSSEKEISKSDSVNFAEKYRETSSLMQIPHGLKLIDQLSPKRGSKILDLGCGTGQLTAALAERVGSEGHVVGVDPDKERLKIAKEKNARTNITYVERSGETFPEDQYDIVFSNYVLHWIEDKDAVFERVSKNIHPGGRFAFIVSYSMDAFPIDVSMTMGKKKGLAIIKSFSFSPLEEYEALANAHGFTISILDKSDQILLLPNFQSALDLWTGITNGNFNPELADKEELEKLREKYGDENLEVKNFIAKFVLAKQ